MDTFKILNNSSSSFQTLAGPGPAPVVPIVPRLMRVLPLCIAEIIGDFDSQENEKNAA